MCCTKIKKMRQCPECIASCGPHLAASSLLRRATSERRESISALNSSLLSPSPCALQSASLPECALGMSSCGQHLVLSGTLSYFAMTCKACTCHSIKTDPGGGGRVSLASLVDLLGALLPPQAAPIPAPGFIPACFKILISRRRSLISLISATFSCTKNKLSSYDEKDTGHICDEQ